MNLKMHQVIALVSGKKTKTQQTLTQAHRWVPEALSGLVKSYTPLDAESNDRVPDEKKLVQVKVNDVIKSVTNDLVDYFNLVSMQEKTNQTAKASVFIDDKVILNDVPVTTLLFLEKQLTDLRTFVSNIPTLPVDKEWKFDSTKNCYVTDVFNQIRTKKVKKVLERSPATDKHPAQTEVYDSDEMVGTYATVYMSGAVTVANKTATLERIEKLSNAVKIAREEANSVEAAKSDIGKSIMQYVFGNLVD